MHEFDDYIKKRLKEEQQDPIPAHVKNKIEETLLALPEDDTSPAWTEHSSVTNRFRRFSKAASLAACILFLFLVLLPNMSTVYAEAFEDIPIISDIVRIVTIRNYFYADDRHNMDVHIPQIDGTAREATDYINKDVEELTQILVEQFRKELEEDKGQAYFSLHIDYNVITNTDSWFTLKVEFFESAGSSNTYYKYYHIDKQNGKIVTLGDLACKDQFYSVLEAQIKEQMIEQMHTDPALIYWIDESPFGQNPIHLEAEHNFYWNSQGDLVIPFDKYEVAPGSMGTPEFTIPKENILDYLSPEYR